MAVCLHMKDLRPQMDSPGGSRKPPGGPMGTPIVPLGAPTDMESQHAPQEVPTHAHDWEFLEQLTIVSDNPQIKVPVGYTRVYECQDPTCREIKTHRL